MEKFKEENRKVSCMLNSNIDWSNSHILLNWFTTTTDNFSVNITDFNLFKSCKSLVIEIASELNNNISPHIVSVNYILEHPNQSIIICSDPTAQYTWKIRYNQSQNNIQVWSTVQVVNSAWKSVRIIGI